ncbi:MAG TPA: nucleotide pyrophosphatase/phosphodiesterase family protein [Actinomycetales bacterium]
MTEGLPAAPPYGEGALSDLLPAVARSLDVEVPPAADGLSGLLRLEPTSRACVLLVDGLGDLLLRERAGHAPFLRGLLDQVGTISAGFPTTTATSMGSLGTGLPPGSHGMVGYEVLVPEHDRLLNELSWDGGPDPRQWQRETTVFQQAAASGVEVVRVGPGYFDGSGLTEAALRGGRFVAASSLDDRVEAALTALRSAPRTLVYVYWGDVDKIGHQEGCGSWQWGEELSKVDLAIRRLVAGLPADATLHVTADHGMVDVPFEQRIDLAVDPDLAAGVRHAGGEPRAPQLYCEPGSADAVLATWADALAGRADVLSREQAVAAGWFGPVSPHVLPRIGDVVVACRTGTAVVDSRRQRPQVLRLLGLHGSLTPQESLVPLLSVRGAGRG